MVSVVASWDGHCRTPALQVELVTHVAQIAAFARGITSPRDPITRFDGVVDGPILLEPGLLPIGHAGIGECSDKLSLRPKHH